MSTLPKPDPNVNMIIKRLEIFVPGHDPHVFNGDQVLGYAVTPTGCVIDVKDKGAPAGYRRYFGCAFNVTEEPSSLVLPTRS